MLGVALSQYISVCESGAREIRIVIGIVCRAHRCGGRFGLSNAGGYSLWKNSYWKVTWYI